jgi:glycosyltransferase involved in cell wall biosynthesis
VSIVMPCLNEARTLPGCIHEAHTALARLAEQGLAGEIIVADNGSTDGSDELARSLGARVVPCSTRGYGAALRCGVLAAHGRYVIMGDADGSYDFRQGVAMVERLREGYELCMGSRFRGTIEPGAMPWKNRYLGNPVLTGILNVLFQSRMSDAHSGLRAFRRDAFLRINPTSVGMEFASEIVIKAALLGLRCTEIPITLRKDGRDRPPHLRPFRDGWRHLRYLVMLSPLWIYFLPAAVMAALGSAVFGLLLGTPSTVARIGPVWIGDHWLIMGAAMLTLSHQAMLLGLAATLVGVRDGYRKVTRMLAALYRASQLEFLLALALLFFVGGGSLCAWVVWQWAEAGFGQLSKLREITLGSTLLMLGMQTLFGGFLLSVVSGNDAELQVVFERWRDPPKPVALSIAPPPLGAHSLEADSSRAGSSKAPSAP